MFFDLQSFIALSQKTNLTSQEKLLLLKLHTHFEKNIDLLQKLYDYSLVAYCANVYLNQSLQKEGLQKYKAIIKALTNPFYKKEKIHVGGLNNAFLALKFLKNYEILEPSTKHTLNLKWVLELVLFMIKKEKTIF